MAAIFTHPDTVSGTTVLEDGTTVYWGKTIEGIVVKLPDGTVIRPTSWIDCPTMNTLRARIADQLNEVHDHDVNAVRGPMNHLQLQEWNWNYRGHLVPQCFLDARALHGGPYTDEQFQAGQIDTKDYGAVYGYAFWPERFTGDPAKVMGTSGMTPGKSEKGRHEFGQPIPIFATQDEAVAYVKEQGFYGRVVRYACDPTFLKGDLVDAYLFSGQPPVKRLPRPIMSCGVTDVVNIPESLGKDCFHGHLMGLYSYGEPVLHYAPAPDTIPF